MRKPAKARKAAQKVPSVNKSLVWLASYPKSGNTWTRIFLANFLLNPDKPVPINQVHRVGIGDSVAPAYRKINGGRYDPMDTLGHLRLRPAVMRAVANNGADINLVKTHNENGKAFGAQLIEPMLTKAAVYIVRNPLDVAVSYARHYGITPSKACRNMARSDNTSVADAGSVKQYLGAWSNHVRSWTKARGFPVHVMRYEDMKADPEAAFGALLDFLKVPHDPERLAKAVRFSSFKELSQQEAEHGFIEKSHQNFKFFHSGTSGQWEKALTDEDIAFMHENQGDMMRAFGYL